MDTILSHTSALQYLRTPPVVHELYGGYPDVSTREGKLAVRSAEHPFGAVNLPLHLLVFDKCSVHQLRTCIFHTWTGELPAGAIVETNRNLAVTGPLFTLLSLAPSLSTAHMTMLLYEMAGGFAVYDPPRQIIDTLQRLVDEGRLPAIGGWRPALDTSGRLTTLWRRPPLVERAEISRFIDEMACAPGIKCMRDALRDVHGVASSPFEVDSSMLLGMPTRRGGWGLGPFEHNYPIRLTRKARLIAGQGMCYADLYLEGSEFAPPLVIECQGNRYHTGSARSAADDNRALALASMGIEVIRLRFEQLNSPERLREVAGHIARIRGIELSCKSTGLLKKELELRTQVLVDWWTIGQYRKRAPRRR